MLLLKKSLQIKKYQNKILTSFLSSQFIYSCVTQKCELKKQQLIIKNKKTKKIYYFYLFLTTKKRPYIKKYYTLSNTSKKKSSVSKTKTRMTKWKVEIKKNQLVDNLAYMLFEIIPFQNNSEKKILKLQEQDLDLIIHYAPLTRRTIGLTPKNSYLSDIPLIWKLKWTTSSIFQKIFILKHLKILNEDMNFQRLENATV